MFFHFLWRDDYRNNCKTHRYFYMRRNGDNRVPRLRTRRYLRSMKRNGCISILLKGESKIVKNKIKMTNDNWLLSVGIYATGASSPLRYLRHCNHNLRTSSTIIAIINIITPSSEIYKGQLLRFHLNFRQPFGDLLSDSPFSSKSPQQLQPPLPTPSPLSSPSSRLRQRASFKSPSTLWRFLCLTCHYIFAIAGGFSLDSPFWSKITTLKDPFWPPEYSPCS